METVDYAVHPIKVELFGSKTFIQAAVVRPLYPDKHANINPSLSGSTDLFCSVDGLLPVLILAPFF